MTLILGGAVRETTRSGDALGSALSVVVKPAGIEHTDEFGPVGARTIQIALPAAVEKDSVISSALRRWRWLHGAAATRPMLGLVQQLASGESGTALEDRILEAVAALCADPPHSDPPGWLAVVKEALDDDLEAGIGVRELARLAGVHPVSVSRAFARHYRMTVTEYRRRLRVRRAAARMGDLSSSLSRIAHTTGHADQPHFCREFRRFTGVSPSEFRRLATPG